MRAQGSPKGIELIPETDLEKAVLGRILDALMHSDFKIIAKPSRTGMPEPKPLPVDAGVPDTEGDD